MAEGKLNPTRQRLEHIDVLRGFALLGILLVNFQYFTRPMQAIMLGSDPGLEGLNLVADEFIRFVGEGKFYPLFSMLFGAGFAIMLDRASQRQAPFWGVYLRRLFVLGLFGLAHVFFVWFGDILLMYSLSAFLMVLLFRKTPLRRLWKWAIVFWIVPLLFMWLGALSIEAARMDPQAGAEVTAKFEADHAAFKESVASVAKVRVEGSYVENVDQRWRDRGFLMMVALFMMPPILGFFLLGRWLIVSGVLGRPEAHQRWLRRWRVWGLSAGLPLAAWSAWLMHGENMMIPTLSLAMAMTLATAASVFVSLGYLSLVTLSSRALAFLAPAGRMALTNYLAQSLVWTWVFYGHGLGLWGQVPRFGHVLLTLVFFGLQVVVSRWWLERFRFGPAEWLWRSVTYWRMQPMRWSRTTVRERP